MDIKINREKLNELMAAFNTLTGIKIILFDQNKEKICSFPEEDCLFCRMMKENESSSGFCKDCDFRSLEECKKSGGLKLYTCYAGLVEGAAPLVRDDKSIGYIMFGQITDLPSVEALRQNASDVAKRFDINEEKLLAASESVELKDYEQIMAAAKICEACVSYIMLNDILEKTEDRIIKEAEKYVDNNLQDATVQGMCIHLGISRTSLYREFGDKISDGVSSFIKKRRFDAAASMLLLSDKTVTDIARECGFYDYNYFSRVFKSRFGLSPRAYRKKALEKLD